MATLDTLIKLTQKKLEDCQKQLAVLDTALVALDAAEKNLKQQITAGYKTARQVEVVAAYQDVGLFLQRAEREQEDIDEQRADVNKKKTKLLGRMRELFAERKRYEVLLETQQTREKKRRAKKEQATLEDLTNR